MRRLGTGTGFGSSPKLPNDPVVAEVPAQHREMLGVGHPHDALLQVWSELGAPGAAFALLLLLMAARHIRRLPEDRRPEAIACLAAAVAIGVESHGAWQAWWIAAVTLPILLFKRLQPTASGPPQA